MKRKSLLLFLMFALLSGSAWAQNCTEQTITATNSYYENFDDWTYYPEAQQNSSNLFSDYEDQHCWYVSSEFMSYEGTTASPNYTPRIWYSSSGKRHLSMRSGGKDNANDPAYDNVVAMPVFSNPLSELTLTFDVTLNQAKSCNFKVGYVNDNDNSFTKLVEFDYDKNYYSTKTFRLSDYSNCPTEYNQHYRIAFCFPSPTADNTISCDVDEIHVTLSQYTITGETDGNGTVTVSNDGTCYAGQTATLTATADEGYHFYQWSDGNTDNPRIINVTVDATYTAVFTAIPYTITNTADWVAFCDAVKGGHDYSGETVRLAADFTEAVTTMAGTSEKRFKGIFDGKGHALIFNQLNATEQYIAPFRYIESATIKDLKLSGSVSTTNKFAGGIVGHSKGSSTITNCINSTCIEGKSGTSNNNGSHGGIIGQVGGSQSITINGCVFNGTMKGNNGNIEYWCGIMGYGSNVTATIKDCLFAPQLVSCGGNSNTICRSEQATPSNCYYTQSMTNNQGTQAYALTLVANPTEGGTVTLSGTAGQTYDVSTITTYGTGNGLDCGGTFYAPAGSCTLTATPNTNYAFVNWTDGSTTIQDNPYTFTVSANRTLTANFVFALTKEIEAYGNSERNNYYLIASPVGDVNVSDVTNLTSGTFNLYSFDQANGGGLLEWVNYDQGSGNAPGFSTLESGKGYLYASKDGTTLTFFGTPYSGDGKVTLSKTDGVRFSGWNLVGNPFAQKAYIDRPFYIINPNGRAEIIAATNIRDYVEPMEGIFVIANSDGEEMTFSTELVSGNQAQALTVSLIKTDTRDAALIDRAIVSFSEESQLPKFQLNPDHTKLYIPQGDKDFAVVHTQAEGELPLNLKVEENGRYTLSVDIEKVSADYLHLIDNMTGADIDLLATPSYTFNARTTDYESRFKLVFAATGIEENPSTGSGTFAYNNGSEWVIANEGNATLQVVDMTGRILSSETINGSCTTAINAAQGVYMLRLVNGENVKVQKVVVR